MPRGLHASGFDPVGLVYLLVVLAVIFSPMLFARRHSRRVDDTGPDDDGGQGPRKPRFPPKPPVGGPPLEDADQSHTRLRDHGRLGTAQAGRRRSIYRPGRRSRIRVG